MGASFETAVLRTLPLPPKLSATRLRSLASFGATDFGGGGASSSFFSSIPSSSSAAAAAPLPMYVWILSSAAFVGFAIGASMQSKKYRQSVSYVSNPTPASDGAPSSVATCALRVIAHTKRRRGGVERRQLAFKGA
eukprot:30975-Pelagococcus_subviridis.AAC.10